jgi:two-component system, OmpR family, sensor kinase
MVRRANPLLWPLTLKIPLLVVALMVVVALAISNVVLRRLAADQEAHLGDLADSYLDGLSAAVQPNLLRRDIWETFDALDRARGFYRALQTKYAVVALKDGTILAASDPIAFPTGNAVPEDLARHFTAGDGLVLGEGDGLAWVRRTLRQDQIEIGSIMAEFDISGLLRIRREVLWTLVLVNVGLVASFSLAGYLLTRRLLWPVAILTDHVDRARSGKLEKIPAGLLRDERTEIGALMASFNHMAGALREREQLAVRLAREEKAVLLGKLASGMAHEVNNPLGGMLNVIDTLRKHGGDPQTRLRALDLLERGLTGIANVVRAALTTYRGPTSGPILRARELDDLQFLLQHEVSRRKLTLFWANALPDAVQADGSTLRQVSLNLLLNACAASPAGSVVEFSAEAMAGSISIRVRDYGPGLPLYVRALFEHPELAPSVPTEEPGLGIWTVCRLVGRARGRIEVLRSDASGTELRVTMPLEEIEDIDAVA